MTSHPRRDRQVRRRLPVGWTVLLALLIGALSPAVPSNADEGFGADTRGGLDGRVIRVTTLADDGAGSLRAALREKGPRLIVFEVGGRIDLDSDLRIHEPHVTVAGQTAPSPGITLAHGGLRISTHDVVVQHLRIRVGAEPGGDRTSLHDRDGIAIIAKRDGSRPVHDVLIDNCSVSWSVDEGISTWFRPVSGVTIRDSIVAEALNDAGHPKGAHGFGMLIGEGSRRVAVVGNLFAHNTRRNPAIGADTTALIANNIVYDAAYNAIHFYGGAPFEASVLDNLVIAGPSTRNMDAIHFQRRFDERSRVHVAGNVGPKGRDAGGLLRADEPDRVLEPVVFATPSRHAGPKLLDAELLPEVLLPGVGARPRDRDAVDRRIVAQVREGSGGTIDDPGDVGGWPPMAATSRPLDPPDDPAGNERWLAIFTAAVE
ncbi:MAG TPA: right-handed parallel beta-helix repeat-containing protein [Arenibaculum sp.]|nr:right-handed parallel beta-helix repeat-containing protein [Arenibaculum sp.]